MTMWLRRWRTDRLTNKLMRRNQMRIIMHAKISGVEPPPTSEWAAQFIDLTFNQLVGDHGLSPDEAKAACLRWHEKQTKSAERRSN
jgi:hypothetical protein